VAPVAELLAGRYEVGVRVGSGGMGDVYRARDLLLDRPVAVKVPSATVTPISAERFKREAQAAARLNHPHIVGVYDWGEGASPFIVMEFVDGRSLRKELSERGPLPPGEVASIGAQIADALAHAHHHGVVHRDVKPSNVLLTRRGEVKVTDFGIAHSAAGEALTEPGVVLGTVGYLSPEQVAGLPIDARSDVYSLGIVLAELLTGERPDGREPPPATPLERIVAKAHAVDPAARHQRADDLRDELRAVARALDPTVVITPTVGTAPTVADQAPTAMLPPASPPSLVPSPPAPPLKPLRARKVVRAPKRARPPKLPKAPKIAKAPKAPKIAKAPKAAKARDVAMPAKPPEPPRARRPHARRLQHSAVAVVLAILLGAGGFVAYQKLNAHPPSVAVPDVVDRDIFSAIDTMKRAGLQIHLVRVTSSQPPGQILAQRPDTGTLEQGSEVTLTMSRIDATVPDVVDLDEAHARQVLAKRGLTNVSVTLAYRDDYDPGTVVSTKPAAYTKAYKSDAFVLVVAADPHVKVPNVIAADQQAAIDELHAKGLEVRVATLTNRLIPSGLVVKQDPSPNSTAVRGDTVTLTVSSGTKSGGSNSNGKQD
jgi:eukaryotic-like serine/threonine-protein kinase